MLVHEYERDIDIDINFFKLLFEMSGKSKTSKNISIIWPYVEKAKEALSVSMEYLINEASGEQILVQRIQIDNIIE